MDFAAGCNSVTQMFIIGNRNEKGCCNDSHLFILEVITNFILNLILSERF